MIITDEDLSYIDDKNLRNELTSFLRNEQGKYTNNDEDIREKLEEINPEMILLDDLDDCIIGVSSKDCAIYSYDRLVRHFNKDMSYEEAIEYVEFNIVGAYMGEYTPVIMYSI
jgi:hypothetical protein